MPLESRRDSDDCTAATALWTRMMVLSRCSPATCSPAWRESSTSAAAAAAMSATGLPANSSDSAILPMSLIDLAPRQVSRNRLVIRFIELNSKILRMRIVHESSEQTSRPTITTLTSISASMNISNGPRWPALAPPTLVGVESGEAVEASAGAAAGVAAAGAAAAGAGVASILRHRRRSCQQRERADQGEKGGGSFCVKHRFASSCLVSARSRTRRDRRAGRLSALAGGGPARTRRRRPRKPKALVATPVPPRSDPISFADLLKLAFRGAHGPVVGVGPQQVLTTMLDLRLGSFGNPSSHRQGGAADRCFATEN